MRFLVRLANKKEFQPSDAKALSSSFYELVRGYGADVGNLRVSSTAIELDLLLESKNSLESATRALRENLGEILTMRELDAPAPQIEVDKAIREGLVFFNEERYWESHEALEHAWRRAAGPEKEVLQGIILVAAALVHLQKNDKTVTLGVLVRANDKLSPYHGEHFGVNIDVIRETVSRMIADKRPDFFRIDVGPYSRAAA
jgi:hypothetical protein